MILSICLLFLGTMESYSVWHLYEFQLPHGPAVSSGGRLGFEGTIDPRHIVEGCLVVLILNDKVSICHELGYV